jgi:hypothetical protein
MEKKFQSLQSEINRPLTRLARISSVLLFAVVFIVLFILPIYHAIQKGILFYIENDKELFFTILVIQVFVLLCTVALIRFYQRIWKSIPVRITVDERGILYYNSKHEMVNSILYTDLLKGETTFYKKDVFTEYSSQKNTERNLTVNIKQNGLIVQTVVNISLDFAVLRNRYSLYAHFIKGIQTFRPDLTLDHLIYSNYYIDQKSQLYSKANQKKDRMAMFFLALTAFGLIYLLVILLQMFA